jgi:DNA modification methylase
MQANMSIVAMWGRICYLLCKSEQLRQRGAFFVQDIQVEWREVAEVTPYARNSRTHSDEQVAQVAASIKEFGWTNPILIDESGTIIAGHGRLMAAQRLGSDRVPTIMLGHLTDAQKRAYVIADNKLALNAGWDQELLAIEVEELLGEGFDLDLTGFGEDEINSLLAEANKVEDGLTDADDAPEVPEIPVTATGDVWVLGRHRVICGDSTVLDTADKVTQKQPVDVVFTDPPYGMSYGGGRAAGSTPKGARVKAHGMIKGDDLQGESLIGLVRDALAVSVSSAKKGAGFYVCFTWRTYAEFEAALEDAGLSVSNCIVWDKKSIGLGNANYRPQHEFIFYVKGDAWHGDRAQSDVWYMSRGGTGEYVHPTQKPVELIEKALLNSSKSGDTVLDVFGGSGSTLIAAEKTGRNARIIELDEKYVDVIVKRWQDFTGQDAVHEESGQTFNGISQQKDT